MALTRCVGGLGRHQCGHAHWQTAACRAGFARRAAREFGASWFFIVHGAVCGHVFGLDGGAFCRRHWLEALHALRDDALVFGQCLGCDGPDASDLAAHPIL